MSSERRTSRRFQAVQGNAEIVLRIGRAEVKAELLNESAGGMEVRAPRLPRVGVGDAVKALVHGAWYKLEVVRIATGDRGISLGLKQVSALGHAQALAEGFPVACRSQADSRLSTRFVLVCLLISGGLLSWGRREQVFKAWGPFAQWVPNSNCCDYVPASFALSSTSIYSSSVVASLHSLKHPIVVEQLNLSGLQQQKIDAICQDAGRSLQHLFQRTSDPSSHAWRVQSTQIVEQALEQVLGSLTEAQVRRWLRALKARSNGAYEKSV